MSSYGERVRTLLDAKIDVRQSSEDGNPPRGRVVRATLNGAWIELRAGHNHNRRWSWSRGEGYVITTNPWFGLDVEWCDAHLSEVYHKGDWPGSTL